MFAKAHLGTLGEKCQIRVASEEPGCMLTPHRGARWKLWDMFRTGHHKSGTREHRSCVAAPKQVRGRRWRTNCLLAAMLALLGWPVFAPAQRIPKGQLQFFTEPYVPAIAAPLRRNVFLVQIHAVVRNRKGRAVADLKRKNFRVYDNGKAQLISVFRAEHARQSTTAPGTSAVRHGSQKLAGSPMPRYIALYFDDRNTPLGDLGFARKAAEKFTREDLHPGDKVGVFTTSGRVALDFTSERKKLLKAISSVQFNMLGKKKYMPSFALQIINEFTMGGLEAVIARLAQMSGQRIVVLITVGFTPMKWQIDQVAQSALRANVRVDSLDAKGLAAPYDLGVNDWQGIGEAGALNDVMSDLAMDTGGTFFHNSNDLAAGLRELTAVPQVSYLLGFSPTGLKDNGSYHRLKVKVTAPGKFKIKARPGYFAPGRASRQSKPGFGELDREVLKANRETAIPVNVQMRPGRLPSGQTGMQVMLHLSPRTLSFQRFQGRFMNQFGLAVALFDGAGKFVTGERGLVNMELKKKTLADLGRRGLNAKIVLQAPEGHYRLRVVVEDFRNGKMFAATIPTGIP